MLRSALILAALLSSMSFAQAQNATRPADQARSQDRDSEAAATTTAPRKDLPFPDMMSSWEYAPQEWQ